MATRVHTVLFIAILLLAAPGKGHGQAIAPPENVNTPQDRVTLDFVEIELSQAIQFLFKGRRDVRFVTAEPLDQKVTVKMVDVPWREALDNLLLAAGYDLLDHSGVLRIVPQKEENDLLVSKEIRLLFIDGWDLVPYLKGLQSPQGTINCYAPVPHVGFEIGSEVSKEIVARDSQGRNSEARRKEVRARVINITDHPANVAAMEERISSLDVMPQQIEVDVKILQLRHDEGRQTGIDWSTILAFSGASRPHTLPWGPHSGEYFEAFPAAPASGFTFGSLAADSLTAVLRLVAENDNAEVISQPNITTLDNVEARILIGQKFPVTTETIDPQTAVRTVSLEEYERIGIQLLVVPTITEGNRVRMVIHPAVSSLEGLVDNRFPIISTREADTQLLLASGETAVIGGLIEKSENRVERRVPWMGSIPFLGALFRYNESLEVRTELVIFVTPRIVQEAHEIEQSLLVDPERLERLRALKLRFEEVTR